MDIDSIMNPSVKARGEQIKAQILIAGAIAETIREAREAPSGIIYAGLMNRVGLAAYEKIVDALVGADLVKRRGDMLVWVGPEFQK